MTERKIEPAWLEQTIASPQLTEPDAQDPAIEHRLAAIAARGYRVLRVVCDPRTKPVKILTVHFDRSMKGKL
jgi:hypothetical protein